MTAIRRRRVTFLRAATADLDRLAEDDPFLVTLALRKIRDLEAGHVDGAPLHALSKSGDLGDCRTLYFGPGAPPSHRIAYRVEDETTPTVEIVEIVAVEARQQLYVYLLAAARLGRLPLKTKPELDRAHQRVVAGREARRRRR